MRKTLLNILAITCVVLILLLFINIAVEGISFRELLDGTIPISLFFQILGVNTVIFCGLFFTQKFESKYASLEILLDICFISVVLIIFGLIFGHYRGRLWFFPIIAVVLYIFGLFTNMIRTQEDEKKINRILQNRKGKNKAKSLDTAS
jgi:hypothetical protein